MAEQYNPSNSLDAISDALSVFTKQDLTNYFYQAAKRFAIDHRAFLLAAHPEAFKAIDMVEKHTKGAFPKSVLLAMCSLPFLNRTITLKFLEKYDPKVSELWYYLLRKGATHYQIIERDLGIEMITHDDEDRRRTRYNYEPTTKVKAAFMMIPHLRRSESYFVASNDIYFYLPADLRELILPYFWNPEEPLSTFEELRELPEGVTLFKGEEVLMRELPGLIIHLNEKRPRMSAKGRPYANAAKGIRKKLKLTEFYDDPKHKDLDNMRTNMLLSLLLQQEDKLDMSKPEEIVRRLINEVYPYHFRTALHLISPYIKGVTSLREYAFRRVEAPLLAHFKRHVLPQWQLYKEYEHRLQSTFFNVDFLEPNHAHGIHFVLPKGYNGARWEQELKIYPFSDERYVGWPAIRASIFFLASWGLADIAYRTPDCSVISQTCDSPYDGIYAFRLTTLGAYVLGHDKTYQSNISQPFKLALSEDALSIMLTDGDMKLATNAIASFARPIGEHRFQTNADLFLANCNTAQDLNRKIELFSSLFPGDLPANWATFFADISRKADPLKADHGYHVFRLSPDDRTLLQLIARDEKIKELCVKAEGHRILVRESDLKKLRTLLRGHGYLVE